MPAGGAPRDWDFTLLPFAPIIRRLLDAVGPSVVVEVGADRGDFTSELLEWSTGREARVIAIDPEPAAQLLELAEHRRELTLLQRPSPEAIDELPPAEVVILDGDHNHFTVSEELRLLSERSASGTMPLLLLHDVGWPHARRDTYYAPDRIPEERRQPLARDAMVAPGENGPAGEGIRFAWAAAREGGPGNGVLTAVEDFLAARQGMRLAIVPAFFGLGVLWDEDAPWATAVSEVIDPWDSNPILDRLEEVRIASIIDRTRLNRQEEVLRGMLNSRAFSLAERISRVRGRGSAALSRERIRRALGEPP
jgi:Methyltransferase domain